MVTLAAVAPGLATVRKGRKPGRVEPSANDHVGASDVAPTTVWPSLISVAPSKARWKYSGLSATRPAGDVVVTRIDTPRDTGSETERPTPAASLPSKTRTVRRPPASTVAVFSADVPSLKKYVMVAAAATVSGL